MGGTELLPAAWFYPWEASDFRSIPRRKELLTLNVKQLMIRQKRLKNNIWRVQDELAKRDKPHLELERLARLQAYQSELAEINRLLGDE